MCTPVAFSFFPSGLTTVPQESSDAEGQDWRENLTQLPQSRAHMKEREWGLGNVFSKM